MENKKRDKRCQDTLRETVNFKQKVKQKDILDIEQTWEDERNGIQ